MEGNGTVWRKSTYSGANGGQCVEVANVWRKSTYSGPTGGQCVEVGETRQSVAVRDTTARDDVTLTIPAPAWRTFTTTLK